MQLFEDQPLAPGLWVVKWIDRVQFGHDAESPKVWVFLQKLPIDDLDEVHRLPRAVIAEILGSRPRAAGSADAPAPVFTSRPILAAYLQRVVVGDVVEGSAKVGQLPQAHRRVWITSSFALQDLLVCSPLNSRPKDWSPDVRFQVLNRYEFHVGNIEHIKMSRCFVFRWRNVEYVLPKAVIFRAFYACSSQMTNALCSGAWQTTAEQLISFRQYQSGIFTGVDPQTGDWHMVLQPGVSTSVAYPLALLWFDPYARRLADGLHTDARKQNEGRRGGDGFNWAINASIPHRLDEGLDMDVQGFSLRPFRPSRPGEDIERFLITAITSSTWSLPKQRLHVESHMSNAPGEVRVPAERQGPYRGRPSKVEGNPTAVATSISDPYVGDATNVFYTAAFEYEGLPPLDRQRKKTSQAFAPAPPPPAQGPSSLVSGGFETHAQVAPSPAEVLAKLRARSQQFEFLMEALQELAAEGHIDSFEPVECVDPVMQVTRSGLPCWSLLSRRDMRRRTVPKSGWEVVHEEGMLLLSGRVGRTEFRHGRCVLILRIVVDSKPLVLLEIEPRPAETAYCMLAFPEDGKLQPMNVAPALDAIRHHEGRLRDAELAADFATLTTRKISLLKHGYRYEMVNGKAVGPPLGLKTDSLLRALEKVVRRSSS